MSKHKGLGDKLRKLREESGKTRVEVADALGVTEAQISYWEGNRSTPHRNLLIPIAKYYGVELSELAKLTDLMDKNRPDLKYANWKEITYDRT